MSAISFNDENQFSSVSQEVEALQSRRSGFLRFVTGVIDQTLPLGNGTKRKEWVQSLNKEIKKIESKKAVEKGIFRNSPIVSQPGVIKREHILTTEVALAPNPEAVKKIQTQLQEEDANSQGHVEMILQSLLLSESLGNYFFTHSEIYTEETPVKIRTYHDDGTFAADIIYIAKKIEAEDGLNAFLLIPKDTPDGIEPEIKLIFVGTKDWAGVQRDLEPGAAGNESFARHRNSLLTKLDSALAPFENGPVKISVTGHSLGGADSQRMVSEIVQIRSQADSPYSRLRDLSMKLRLETSAAPGLTEVQCSQFAEALENAATGERGENFEFRAIASIYDLDAVPTCGRQHILANSNVLSLAAEVHLINTPLALFQHESELYCDERKVPERNLRIFQTVRSVDGAEGPQAEQMRQAIVDQLSRIFRIDIR